MSEHFAPVDGWMFCNEHHEMWGEGNDMNCDDDGNEACRSWVSGEPPCPWVAVFVKEEA
jgi:hypothetical protein